MFLQKLISYLNIFSKANKTRDINLKLMHGINRISIFMFLIALVVMLVRWLAK